MNLELWKQRKKELHLNYTKIAEVSGISKRTVEDIFRGFTKTPRIDTVQAIERALGLSDSWTADDYANGVMDTKKVSITPLEEDLLTLFRDIGYKGGEEKQLLYLKIGETILQTTKK